MPPLKSMALKSSVRAVDSLVDAERRVMHQLMDAHYEAVAWERFLDDLAAKDEVLMLHDPEGVLRGFTTIAWNPAGIFAEGDVLFSGDTIIDKSCWGTQELVRAFCRRAGEWRTASGRRLFWFLISKGRRTYMYLPLFAQRFFPHPENNEPEFEMLAAKVASGLFGDHWKPEEGVIRFPSSLGHLRKDYGDEHRDNVWSRFFLQRNLGHVRGEELVCLTEMEETNLRRGARSAFREGIAARS